MVFLDFVNILHLFDIDKSFIIWNCTTIRQGCLQELLTFRVTPKPSQVVSSYRPGVIDRHAVVVSATQLQIPRVPVRMNWLLLSEKHLLVLPNDSVLQGNGQSIGLTTRELSITTQALLSLHHVLWGMFRDPLSEVIK